MHTARLVEWSKRGLAIKWERASLSRLDGRLLRSSRREVGDELWRSRARLRERCALFSGMRPECHTGAAGLGCLFEAARARSGHERAQGREIQPMAAAIGAKNSGDRRAGERQVAQRVEHL